MFSILRRSLTTGHLKPPTSSLPTRSHVSIWLNADDWVTRYCEASLFTGMQYGFSLDTLKRSGEVSPEQYTLRVLRGTRPSIDGVVYVATQKRAEPGGIQVFRGNQDPKTEGTLRFPKGAAISRVDSGSCQLSSGDTFYDPDYAPGKYFLGRLRGVEGWVHSDDVKVVEHGDPEASFATMCDARMWIDGKDDGKDDKERLVGEELECNEHTRVGDLVEHLAAHVRAPARRWGSTRHVEPRVYLVEGSKTLSSDTMLKEVMDSGMVVVAYIDGQPYPLNDGQPLAMYRYLRHPRCVELELRGNVAGGIVKMVKSIILRLLK